MAMQTRSRPTTGAIGVLRKGCSDGPTAKALVGSLATAGARDPPTLLDEF